MTRQIAVASKAVPKRKRKLHLTPTAVPRIEVDNLRAIVDEAVLNASIATRRGTSKQIAGQKEVEKRVKAQKERAKVVHQPTRPLTTTTACGMSTLAARKARTTPKIGKILLK